MGCARCLGMDIGGLTPPERHVDGVVEMMLNAIQSYNKPLNDERLLDGFVGKLTSSKWANLSKCSQDTALRDINDLLKQRVLVKEQGGANSLSDFEYLIVLIHLIINELHIGDFYK